MNIFGMKAQNATLQISGMNCGACVSHVSKALEAVNGVRRVSVDLASGRAQVEGKAENQALIAAVQNAGYGAEIV
ncbi:MAG TPA: cation transporter [Abditibacterium sp.]|jgi:copper chaperone CopZ